MYSSFALIASLFFVSFNSTTIEAEYDEASSSIIIHGLDISPDDIRKRVSIYFGGSPEITSLPEVIGRYEHAGDDLRFYAKYGLSPGCQYTVIIWKEYDVSIDKRSIANRLTVNIPSISRTPSTSIQSVFPSSSQLPMNQLKLYIEFSAPMSVGKSSEYVKLYRMPGYELEKEAFLITHEELWDPDRKRLTIFFDPGRIKRGVQPNLQLGLPLVEGRACRLVIDEAWPDRHGTPLVHGYIKDFEVVAADRSSPDPKKWIIQSPATPDSPITICFQESMDYGLLHSTIEVVKDDRVVQGNIHLENQESTWIFTPNIPWLLGDYEIHINPWLEDLAGNNLRRKFDVDLTDPKDQPRDIEEVVLPFQINALQTKN